MILLQRAHHRDWRVGTKLLGLIVPLVALVTIMTAWGLHERNTAKLHEKLIQRARSLHTQIMADREYYAAVILPRIRQLGGSFGADYRRVHGRFPLPATFVREVSARTATAQEWYKANLISPWPINQDQGIKDQFQRDAFAYLMANPSGQFFRTDTSEGRAVMRVLMADRASAQSCVSCHNAHPQSPKHDFRLNDLMGGLEIEMPMDQYLKENQQNFLMTVVGGTALCLVVVGIVALGTMQTVTRPLATLARNMRKLSGTSEEPPPEIAVAPLGDEVAELTATFEQMQAIILAQQTQLRGANEQLEERVLERTQALQKSEEQLRHAQKMEAIGRLAGGIAHDFNNLLVVIKGYSEILLRRLSHEDPLHMLAKEINEAGDRAATLTRQLLAFSRNQMLEPKVLDLNTLVTDLDKMLRRVIGEDIDLVTVLEPALGRVEADPGQLEQVLMNLAVNARDAMPEGGKLTIETANAELDENYVRQRGEAQPGSYVMLAVSDTGCGMDAQTQAHIFEPFFTTKEPGKGTGLGLSTVFGIIKQSGGNIWVYSEPGRGATFKIYLPRLDREIKAAEGGEALAIPPRGSETILVVEDEEKVLTLECSILRENGYTVLAARDGHDALRICQEHPGPIHLLVTDVVMPDMNGRELAQQMAPLRPAMKVLYVSGYTDDAVIRHGVLEANTAFLQKPFASEVLLRKVCEVLNGSNASRQQGD